ncbi:MAG TPA: RluA family pseudouridine synthase [Elusimicrobiota bacterium]|jgi:23S rRNA pseudouridine1911/1915/1917 synthase|nr:RluA family pseudouridine synthase [Elusimicrobiota bacterium]
MPAAASAVAEEWIEVPFRALKEHAGLRLDAFLVARLHRYSRANVQKLIDDGRVSVAGRSVKASRRVAERETVLIRYPRAAEPPVPHEVMPVLYQDDSLVVIDKPGGTLSHPTDKILHNTVTAILARQLGRKVFLAHRLDRETSGAQVLALDADAARSLYEQFLGRTVRKEYLAVVFGDVAWKRKLLDAPLGPEGGEIRVRQAVGAGQPAVTEFTRLATDGKLSLVSGRPKTGRLHQLRAHLAHLGHPVVGDKLYVGSGEAYMKAVRGELGRADLDALGADRQLLHAWKLSFDHPVTGRRLELEAPVPADFPLRPEAP